MWRRQKQAALAGIPLYEYAVGPGYDRIPADVVVAGFPAAFSDRSHKDVINNTNHVVMLPADRANAGRFGKMSDWREDGGYGVMSDYEVMVDLAPIFPNLPSRGVGNVAGMRQGLHTLDNSHGHAMPGGTHVLDTNVHQRNANNPVGMLTVAAAPEVTPKGSFNYFPSLSLW